MLPSPEKTRFQPLRSGLINLFKYENQEFWYERGRLLVRGNNGTGKSRVLALQLPFLFDGEIASHRVEPDADPARQLVWHLLMDEHEQRTGYTWIEFGRRDEAGMEHYLTLGCGMRGVRGGDDQPKRWFFITEQRVGQDFQLVEGAYPHSKERLIEVLGDSCFFASAKDYRAEIDRRLFSLGRGRYAALIELLIRLRAPQLSKKLDEKTIFTALSNALPPLSEDVVGPVADAFKQLDDLRQQFASLQSLRDSLEGFQSGYQTYLQMAIQLRAERVRSTHSAYESAQRKVNAIDESIQAAEARKAEAAAQVQQAHDHYTAAEARYTALSTSPAAGDAKRLETAHELAQEKTKQASQAEVRAQNAAQQHEQEQQALSASLDEQQKHQQQRDHDWNAATQHSHAAGFSSDHAKLIQDANAWPADSMRLEKLKADFKRLAGDHEHRLQQIEDGLAVIKKAQTEQAAAQVHEDQCSAAVEAHREDVRKHEGAADAALKTLAANYAAWRDGLRWLSMPAWSELAPAFEDWLETAEEQHRVLAASLSSARNAEATTLATARADLKTRRDQLHRDREELRQEQASLAQQSSPPPAPRTRDTAARQGRAGAPLWQVCEFQPTLTDTQRTGLEAALEAAGLLDAWITPDGSLMGDFPQDTFLSGRDESALRGETLESWLIPDLNTESGLSEETLRRVLRHIGAGAGSAEHWVALDGRWQLGPVAGRGCKPQAEHLGANSR
ncbi:MAG: TIGR02680 family protein, partial [Prosthecobacter sp.]|nr:TIGR02680 family protein [Prosthecobacter sp.]